MPKAVLEFDLPEDKDDFKLACDGSKWYGVASHINLVMRNHLKYGHEFKNADMALESVREELFVAMGDAGISFDDVE